MACAGHCLGAAMATVPRLLHQFASCANAPRCHGVACTQSALPLQPAAAFAEKGGFGVGTVWRTRGGVSLASGRRVIALASPDSSTSTRVDKQLDLQLTQVERKRIKKELLQVVVQEVEFVWKGPGSTILLSGDFVNWESQLPLEKTGSDGWFVVKQKLAPGTHKYKYIVDGEWKHSPDYPTVSDHFGGFNNEITVAEDKSSSQSTSMEGTTQAEVAVKAPPAPKGDEPKAAGSLPKPKVAAKKPVTKPLPEAMSEDIVPKLTAYFEKEKGVSDVEIKFDDNQLQGSFIKNKVPYNFWAYFPDGKFEGSRGFSLTSHGSPQAPWSPSLLMRTKYRRSSLYSRSLSGSLLNAF